MTRLVLPNRPCPGDLVQVNGGPVHRILAAESGGRLRLEDESTVTWRLEREVL